MEISFLLFTLTELKKVYQEENNYICYDKSHKHLTCVLAGVTDIDTAIHWYVYICTCMYVYACVFIGDVPLFETLGTKTQHGCPQDDLLLSSCLNTSEFPLLRLIN